MQSSNKELKLVEYFFFLILITSGCYPQHQAPSEIVRPTIISINGNPASIPTITPTDTATNTPTPSITGKIAFLSVVKNKDTNSYEFPKLYVIDFECTKSLDECKSRITHLADDIDDLSAPSWSPDGKQIVVARYRFAQPPGNIYIINADGSKTKELLNQTEFIHQPIWSPANNLIAFFDTNVGARIIRADGKHPITLMQTDAFVSSLNWSLDGKYLAFEHLIVRGGWQNMYVVAVDEERQVKKDAPKDDNVILLLDWGKRPSWSPDGKHIAYVCSPNLTTVGENICLLNVETKESINLTKTSSPTIDDQPMWSPDGEHIAFISDRDGNRDIYVMNADGSGETRLTNTAADEVQPSWSPDSKYITFISNRDNIGSNCDEIYIMKSDGTGQRRLTNNDTCDIYPVWGPE